MPLPESQTPRSPLHHRQISVQGYLREDGNFDIEGHLCDTKAVDFKLQSGVRPAGEAVHSMWLRITIDRTLTIIDAEAVTDAMPYPGQCDQITPEYKKLIGMAIRPGFSNQVKSSGDSENAAKKRAEDLTPTLFIALYRKAELNYCQFFAGGAWAALPNSAKYSLPTKPNLLTPEPLMMLSTRAERS